MDTVTQPFQLDYGPPGTVVRAPRLWRLAIGVLITMACVAQWLPWIVGLPGVWAEAPATDIRLGLAALGASGIATALHALTCEVLHVQQVRLGEGGLSIQWSHVPHLFAPRVEKLRQVAWRDVDHLAWQEGSMEHDLKQHLLVYLKTPLTLKQKQLKLLVCDERDADRCEGLIRHLPISVATPTWLATTRLRRQNNTAY